MPRMAWAVLMRAAMLALARSRSLSSIRRLAGALVLVSALAALVGCAEDFAAMPGQDNEAGVDAGVGADLCFASETGECVVATDGCSPAAISGSALERCATCEQDEGPHEICGPTKTARCFDLELGQPCQRCVADDGEVLYDDCATPADEAGDLTCEAVAYEGADAACEVCRDDNGVVVRESCRPNASRCEDRVVNGRECRECFTDEGAFAYRECARPALDPVLCEAYGGPSGRCVDCYGRAGELLSHECTATQTGVGVGQPSAPPEVAYCDAVTDPSGRSCTLCYSAEGGLVEERCEGGVGSGPARCEELSFSDQVCVVCVDGNGQEASTQCYGAVEACANPSGCAPAPCENRYLDDGTLCRTCPTGGGGETLCMSGGGLVCETVQEFNERPGDGEGEPSLTSEVCTVCHAAGVDEAVYGACSTDGTVPPQPVCSLQETADGVACEVCVDPAGGGAVYSSCPADDAGADDAN